MKQCLFTIFLLLSIGLSANAQLSFPQGNNLNLNTSLNYLYLETEILFHTGKYKVDNYRWERVFDSVDSRWQVHSCFNGDCWNDRPETSNFVGEFGENDTTGFIRFHVWSYDFDGSLSIKYKVINNKDSLDQSTLSFHITFKNLNGIEQNNGTQKIILYPNPTNSYLNISSKNSSEIQWIKIHDIHNKVVFESSEFTEGIDISNFSNGIYMVRIMENERLSILKFNKF